MADYAPQHLRDWLTDANLDGRYFWIYAGDPVMRLHPAPYPADPNYLGRHALAAQFDPPIDPDTTLLTERLVPHDLDEQEYISREIGAGRGETGYPLGGAGREHLQTTGYDYVRED